MKFIAFRGNGTLLEELLLADLMDANIISQGVVILSNKMLFKPIFSVNS